MGEDALWRKVLGR